MKNVFLISCFALVAFVMGCCDSPEQPSLEEELKENINAVDKTKLESDLKIIDDSLQRAAINAEKEPNGVRYVVRSLGTGDKPTLSSTIRIKYIGKLLTTKSVFDQNQNISFPLNNLIIGWKTVLPLLPEGSKVTLYIPSGYGYGSQASTYIPANSNLIFEVDLLEVL